MVVRKLRGGIEFKESEKKDWNHGTGLIGSVVLDMWLYIWPQNSPPQNVTFNMIK